MAQRPPPFAALRALEAACRHRSYSAAAAELNVTHSAVSQAIRRLEEEVGTKLFRRRGANMEPAAASLALARAYADASQTVARALRHISENSPNGLTIAAPALVARLWLNPLLVEIAQRFPALSLRLRTEAALDSDVDLNIQLAPPAAGFDGERLGDTSLSAYASSAFLQRHPIGSVEALSRAPVLIEGEGEGWTAWFEAAGVPLDGPLQGLRFDDASGLALDAATRGLGLVLCDALSASDLVARGELEMVCGGVVAPGPVLWVSWRHEHPKARLINPLALWLKEMLAQRVAGLRPPDPQRGGARAAAA